MWIIDKGLTQQGNESIHEVHVNSLGTNYNVHEFSKKLYEIAKNNRKKLYINTSGLPEIIINNWNIDELVLHGNINENTSVKIYDPTIKKIKFMSCNYNVEYNDNNLLFIEYCRMTKINFFECKKLWKILLIYCEVKKFPNFFPSLKHIEIDSCHIESFEERQNTVEILGIHKNNYKFLTKKDCLFLVGTYAEDRIYIEEIRRNDKKEISEVEKKLHEKLEEIQVKYDGMINENRRLKEELTKIKQENSSNLGIMNELRQLRQKYNQLLDENVKTIEENFNLAQEIFDLKKRTKLADILIKRNKECLTCPICLETISEEKVNISNCEHFFCDSCKVNIIRNRVNNCPVCRKNNIKF